jgi:hypothetical protein
MIKFVRSADHRSYTDYWRLVELGGFEIVGLDKAELDNPEHVYITTFFDGNLLAALSKPTRARVILWHIEWTEDLPQAPGLDEVWVSDRWYAQKIGARFVPFGSHPDLITVKNAPGAGASDVCTLSYAQYGSRRWITEKRLKEQGVTLAPNGWDGDRDSVLENSRLMMHVHQRADFPCIAMQRFAIAASARIPLVSETINNPFPLVDGEDVFMVDYGDLSNTIKHYLENPPVADGLYQKLCIEYRFDKVVRNVLC